MPSPNGQATLMLQKTFYPNCPFIGDFVTRCSVYTDDRNSINIQYIYLPTFTMQNWSGIRPKPTYLILNLSGWPAPTMIKMTSDPRAPLSFFGEWSQFTEPLISSGYCRLDLDE
jgi:hypothetical protein